MNRIYIEAEEKIIKQILEIGRKNLGEGVNSINLNPELKEEQ